MNQIMVDNSCSIITNDQQFVQGQSLHVVLSKLFVSESRCMMSFVQGLASVNRFGLSKVHARNCSVC